MNYPLPQKWMGLLGAEFERKHMRDLDAFLEQERAQYDIYPDPEHVFLAFQLIDMPSSVRVVVVGQDPYHGPHQATGLAFAVTGGLALPPSLKNIWKEIHSSSGCTPRLDEHGKQIGELDGWARQGVLMLNTSLTVRAGEPGSHAGHGWEQFTDAAIQAISTTCEHVVFILWGKHAQHKRTLIDERRHLILESAHPSPFSAYKGFLGNGHFQKTNEYLKDHDLQPINWCDHV